MPRARMQEPTYLILTALADEPRHGYGLIREVEAMSNGRVRLKTGTLYTALDRLEAAGLIAAVREELVDGRHRTFYALSQSGASLLEDETKLLRANTAEARRRLRVRAVAVTNP